jgi:hypothetical protein
MMCLLLEIHDTCLNWNWVSEVELSGRTQVIVAVMDLCLRPLACQFCVAVPSQPYNARCRASEEYV